LRRLPPGPIRILTQPDNWPCNPRGPAKPIYSRGTVARGFWPKEFGVMAIDYQIFNDTKQTSSILHYT